MKMGVLTYRKCETQSHREKEEEENKNTMDDVWVMMRNYYYW